MPARFCPWCGAEDLKEGEDDVLYDCSKCRSWFKIVPLGGIVEIDIEEVE